MVLPKTIAKAFIMDPAAGNLFIRSYIFIPLLMKKHIQEILPSTRRIFHPQH